MSPPAATDHQLGALLAGNAASIASRRISSTLGLDGPSLTIGTACSSLWSPCTSPSRSGVPAFGPLPLHLLDRGEKGGFEVEGRPRVTEVSGGTDFVVRCRLSRCPRAARHLHTRGSAERDQFEEGRPVRGGEP
ncbi:beta-ketoacyl synthase N-terminal-like domain-containing protein [Streptomyces noboritoensis]|uniref:Beta-ketoacyl synthase N-terminal-like domain-containing protein n=1 Tax=Streptomyces noboritoensis TaxID=67337 RepID=A0ABV6TDB1_9ACTN